MTTLPSAMVTFLFTDIECPTKLALQSPVAMPYLTAKPHNDIPEKSVQDLDSYLFPMTGRATQYSGYFTLEESYVWQPD